MERKGRIYRAVFVSILTVALAFTVLLGCAQFDAPAYTQAVLDVIYKNQCEGYTELTGASQQEAEAIFQKNLDATMNEFKTLKLPETLENNYSMLFKDVVQQVHYTVGEAVETEDGNYRVAVSVEPMLLFDDTYETFQEETKAYAESITDSVMSGGEMPGEEEIENQVYQIYYEILQSAVDAGVRYGEAQNVIIHINRMEDGTYEIPKEEIGKLNLCLISREKLQNS